jgi:hypothetical protein
MYATAIDGATLTVLRAQEGTVAQAFLGGDFAFNGPTAAQMVFASTNSLAQATVGSTRNARMT